MDSNIRKKVLLVSTILFILIYMIYYLTMIIKGEITDHHVFFILGVGLLLLISIRFWNFQDENKLLVISNYILIVAILLEFINQFNIFESSLFIDITFHLISSSALILVLIGTYQTSIKNHKKAQITSISYEQNETFIIEYFVKQNQLVIEFSPKFLDKYKGIEERILTINPEVYRSYVHKDDLNKVNNSEAKYRIKFPGMNKYIYVFTKCSLILESRIICFGFDISDFIKYNQNIYELFELEKRKIVESYQDLVAKFKTDGTIVYASSNYAKLFNLDEDSIIGKNVLTLNQAKGLDIEWFYETMKNHTYRGQGTEMLNNEKIWISWQNDVLLDDEGKVEYVITIGRNITELIELNQSFEYQSLHDYLTGLLNRRGLYEELKTIAEVKNAISFFIEIEHFSSINDYYGNDIGDLILKKVADELKICGEKNIIARYSGAQFVLICIDLTNNQKLILLNKMKSLLNKMYHINDNHIHIHKRIGYAEYPYDSNDLINLISLSSLAKNEISDQHLVKLLNYQSYMSAKLYRNINMSIKLIDALKKNLIDVFFQKIINVQNNEVSYIEALARWQDKDKGFISPLIFFEVAKLTNILDQLDLYIFKKAIEKYASLRLEPEFKNTILTINITPQTLLQNDISEKVEEITKQYEINPKDVCIEISENTFVNNLNVCKENIKLFKEKGFLIALDDFGREYSSLSILDNIEFDLIKIDGVFVRNIFKPQNQAIIQMVMKISEISNKQIIAECVETDEESKILNNMKCFLQQGYYFHKPEKL